MVMPSWVRPDAAGLRAAHPPLRLHTHSHAAGASASALTAACHSSGCPASLHPVCGRDGRSYSNPCVAACAAVEVQHEGYCAGGTQASDTRGGVLAVVCAGCRCCRRGHTHMCAAAAPHQSASSHFASQPAARHTSMSTTWQRLETSCQLTRVLLMQLFLHASSCFFLLLLQMQSSSLSTHTTAAAAGQPAFQTGASPRSQLQWFLRPC